MAEIFFSPLFVQEFFVKKNLHRVGVHYILIAWLFMADCLAVN